MSSSEENTKNLASAAFYHFYVNVLERELADGRLTRDARVLVTCGGDADRSVLAALGFRDVVISNLAPHQGHQDYRPFRWERQDAEALSYDDGSFDAVIVHSGLHHCHNPYRALGEMCRVSRHLVVGFEPYETWFTRLGAELGYGQKYEDAAVHLHNGDGGGVAGTDVPNFVYRFTEREISKFAHAYFAHAAPPLRFYRALRVNSTRFAALRNPVMRASMAVAQPALKALARVVPALNNNFAFVIERPRREHYHPWIDDVAGRPAVDRSFLATKYSPKT